MGHESVERAYEYRRLTGKRDQLGRRLTPRESARLAELERKMAAPPCDLRPAFAGRELEREHVRLPAVLESGLTLRDARVSDLSASGMHVETLCPLELGARVVVRLGDATSGQEWRFAAEVVRVTAVGVGVALRGIPLALRHGVAPLWEDLDLSTAVCA